MANHNLRIHLALFSLLLLLSISQAQDATQQLEKSLSQLCNDIQSLIPPLALLLMMSAGVIYAGGQMGGAEMRAKASAWATSCVTGAVVGILISIIAPTILGIISGIPSAVVCSP
ncbi:MAG: hypothetical protein V1728_03150 [Candidatus Micrarchaeota archaeon]